MLDLQTEFKPSAYASIYSGMSALRESFHRSGRLDDSNAKLDEVAKLYATYLAFKMQLIKAFPAPGDRLILDKLQKAFVQAASLPIFQNFAGDSIFGANPTLSLRDGDEELAMRLVEVVREGIDIACEMRIGNKSFDLINEAFGHFIRDNFRGNIEDAQYMTPPEVVDFMVALALNDIGKDDPKARDKKATWTVLDPTCGVGSFLTALYQGIQNLDWINSSQLKLFGQDKVERMVRLSTINMTLFDVKAHQVSLGNSLIQGSPIDSLHGSVDLILTNPPFGAKFDQSYIALHSGDNTPFFSRLRKSNAKLDSELLFIDRNLQLLREGGRLLIVVPDGVVSARGTAAMLRSHLIGKARVRAVVELPAVAFAQAGTRTRTSILYLEKNTSRDKPSVFIASARDLGFQVSSRKGVQVKIELGRNELPQVLAAYKGSHTEDDNGPSIISTEPSCVLVPSESLVNGSWTPNHYRAERFAAASRLAECDNFIMVPLKSLVEFASETRTTKKWQSGWGFISVLHVLGEGFIDCGAALNYSPKTPGTPVNPGEILFSGINPRIPRVATAPDLDVPMLCSSEFVILVPVDGWSPEAITYLLLSEIVQTQIQSLTSGTSASHNRIRVAELANVLLPTPAPGTDAAALFDDCIEQYRQVTRAMGRNAALLARLRSDESRIFQETFGTSEQLRESQ